MRNDEVGCDMKVTVRYSILGAVRARRGDTELELGPRKNWRCSPCCSARPDAADTVLTAAPALTEEVLAMLRQAVEHHPFDEALHCRVIAALAATGRQVDALRQFETIRRALADELGVDPGPDLRAAQQHLLRPRAVQETAARAPRSRTGTGPAKLPADPACFAGRGEVLAECLGLLPPEGGSHPPTRLEETASGVACALVMSCASMAWGVRTFSRIDA